MNMQGLTTHQPAQGPYVRIEPTSGWAPLQLRRLWAHRELIYFWTWREVKVRYKQTVLGALWAILQPVVTMLIFSLFFGRLAKMPSDGLPYPVFVFVALLPWTFVANTVTLASNSLVSHTEMIKKVAFPRITLPISSVLAGILDLALAFVVLVPMLLWYGVLPGPRALLLPLLSMVAVAAALGVGLWLSALNIQFRDVRYAVPFLVQVWLFASPVAYPSSLVPDSWRALYGLNPIVGVADGFRWALLDVPISHWGPMTASCLTAAALLVSGAYYFRRVERTFADVA